jgi:hypothetical protein
LVASQITALQYPCFDLAGDLGFAILGGIHSTPKRLHCNVLFIPSVAGHSDSPEEGPALPPPGAEKSGIASFRAVSNWIPAFAGMTGAFSGMTAFTGTRSEQIEKRARRAEVKLRMQGWT